VDAGIFQALSDVEGEGGRGQMSTAKKSDDEKLPMDLLPWESLEEVAAAFLEERWNI
jgi:hypothetical protein